MRVDTTIDQGHKLQVSFPNNKKLPAYATMIERPMWSCERIPESDRAKLKPDHSPQLECAYSFKKVIDFEGLSAYIAGRERRKGEVEERNAEIKKLRAAMIAGDAKGIDESAAKALAGSGE